MIFRRASAADLTRIYAIYSNAKKFMSDCGFIQWKGDYPQSQTASDIDGGFAYVLCEDENICAVAVIRFDGEHTYDIIRGKWLTKGEYAVIHRIACAADYRRSGCASRIIAETALLCKKNNTPSIRIDTHRDNIAMQRMLAKNGFIYCGIIRLDNGEERLAYELIV